MINQSTLNDNVDSLFKSLENFTQNEGIIGKPVTQGDKTFLPIVSITVGYGGGNATMNKNTQAGSAMPGSGNTGTDALGLGAKICTDAVIIINGQEVSLHAVNSSAGNVMDKIPQILQGMNLNKNQTPNNNTPSQS